MKPESNLITLITYCLIVEVESINTPSVEIYVIYNKDIRMRFDISITSAHFILHLLQKFHFVIYMTEPY